jgi:site-specific DNA-cytosine methylase
MKTAITLFTGGGLADVALAAAGFRVVAGVEIEPEIAAIANKNLGNHVRVGDVLEARPEDYPSCDLLHVSPPCTRASVANSKAVESELDIAFAGKIVEFLRVLRPAHFTLENVRGYQRFKAYRIVLDGLRQLGYQVSTHILNAASYGVPQTRIRLIVMASLNGRPSKPSPTHQKAQESQQGLFESRLPRWVGWYEAIEDLIDTLPESRFAEWQLRRLKPELIETIKGHDNENAITFEALRILQGRIGIENLQKWLTGIWQGFQETKILQSGLHGEEFRANGAAPKGQETERYISLLLKEICAEGELRTMRSGKRKGRASQGRGLDEQFFGEFTAYLSALSHEGTCQREILPSGELLRTTLSEGLLQQALSSFQKIRQSIVFQNANGFSQEKANGHTGGFRCQSKGEEVGYFIKSVIKESEGCSSPKSFLACVQGESSDYLNTSEPSPSITATHGAAKYRAFIVGAGGYDGTVVQAKEDSPCFTITANQNQKDRLKAFIVPGGNSNSFSIRDAGEPARTIGDIERVGNLPRAFIVNESSTMECREAQGSCASQVASSRNLNQRAFIIDGKPSNYAGDLQICESHNRIVTLTATQQQHPFRAWLDSGKVVKMTPRCLARFQSLPDWYELPESDSLACKIIGNGVPCLMMEAVARSFNE